MSCLRRRPWTGVLLNGIGDYCVTYAFPVPETLPPHRRNPPFWTERAWTFEMIDMATATTPGDFQQARQLKSEYEAWPGLEPEFQGFQQEMVALERMYGPPGGSMLLAQAVYMELDVAEWRAGRGGGEAGPVR